MVLVSTPLLLEVVSATLLPSPSRRPPRTVPTPHQPKSISYIPRVPNAQAPSALRPERGGGRRTEHLPFVTASGTGEMEALHADENPWLSQRMMAQL